MKKQCICDRSSASHDRRLAVTAAMCPGNVQQQQRQKVAICMQQLILGITSLDAVVCADRKLAGCSQWPCMLTSAAL